MSDTGKGHTPTPWRIGADDDGDPVIFADDGKPEMPWTICEMCGMPDDDGGPNAAFIVEAVNNYDRLRTESSRVPGLVRALRNLLAIAEVDLNLNPNPHPHRVAAIKEAHAALAPKEPTND